MILDKVVKCFIIMFIRGGIMHFCEKGKIMAQTLRVIQLQRFLPLLVKVEFP